MEQADPEEAALTHRRRMRQSAFDMLYDVGRREYPNLRRLVALMGEGAIKAVFSTSERTKIVDVVRRRGEDDGC